jgi:hypothetical protein
MTNMTHKRWQELIPFYLAQTLDETEQREFEIYLNHHRAQCEPILSEWRSIASAVWQQSNEEARKLPALSPHVYNQLAYRRGPIQQATQLPQQHQINTRHSSIVIASMVAGFAVAVLFGAAMLLAAYSISTLLDSPEPNMPAVAAQVTPTDRPVAKDAEMTATMNPQQPTTDNTTLTVDGTTDQAAGTGLRFVTNTPPPVSPTSTEPLTLLPTATEQDNAAITPITRTELQQGVPARVNSNPTPTLPPPKPTRMPTTAVPTATAYIQERDTISKPPAIGGSISGAQSVTGVQPSLTNAPTPTGLIYPESPMDAIIDALSADIRQVPDALAPVIQIARQREQYEVHAFMRSTNERWVQIVLEDGEFGWILEETIELRIITP